uniref:SWIM-type domain-containing protein n=1 Tax=Lactuca sativa TaxID=4236 RepID=A0A9R1W351_LACSA|nr:hypothetical protein LSAT_V11C300144060 [Lactuca sativa]
MSVLMMDWDLEHEGNTDPFFCLREPFFGLNEMDFELHGIYMDHEPYEEFITPLDKCKDAFLNVLLTDENIRNSSLTNDVRAQVYHRGDLQSDEDEEEQEQFCIQNYAVHNGYQIYFEKCDSTRILVRCGKRNEDNCCPFRLYAPWMFNERSIQIKTLEATHVCGRKFKLGSMVTPEWIGRHYITEIANKPKVKLKEMITDIRQRFRIWDYAQELLRSNPGSTCKVCVTVNPDEINYFHRFYIGFKAICEGWKRAYRRVIGLDGCFLKGAVKGELLTTIGRDANNQTWFFELLKDDLDLDSGRGLVVISDQHKGLLESMKDILPHVEHMNCARHIYANFRKAFTGVEYKKLFWAAFRSCTEGDFKRHMESIKKLSPSAYEYLMSKQPETWCRAYFGTGYACEAVENGMSECFNSIILDARKKPLITMLEEIQIYIMDRFWGIIHSQGHVFEARRGCDSYRVDLDNMTCSCRLWDLAGIPCVHANAAINFIHQTPDAYINAYFSKEKFRQCYSTNIEPVNGTNLWAQTEYIKPLPPMSRRMPGRPATKRKRHANEKESKFSTKKVKVARTTRCGNCLEYGDNIRACKNERKQYVPPPPKKTGRPRKHLIPHVSTSPGQPNLPSQPSCSNTVRRSPRKHNTLRMSPRKHQQQASSKRFRRNSIDVPRKKLCTRRGGGRICSATIGTQESVVQQVPLVDEGENVMGDNVGQSVVQQVPVVNKGVQEEGVVQEVPVIHIQDGHMMQEGESSQASVMEGNDTFRQVGSSIGRKLKSTNDENEQGIDAILEGVNFTNKTKSSPLNNDNEVEDNQFIEFTKGKDDDILPEKIQLGPEEIASMLEAGYSMAEIEAMREVQVELDDSPPVELDRSHTSYCYIAITTQIFKP